LKRARDLIVVMDRPEGRLTECTYGSGVVVACFGSELAAPVRAVRRIVCWWVGPWGRFCQGRGPCKGSPPSRGTGGASDLFHVAVSRKGAVLLACFELTLTNLIVTNGRSYLEREHNGTLPLPPRPRRAGTLGLDKAWGGCGSRRQRGPNRRRRRPVDICVLIVTNLIM